MFVLKMKLLLLCICRAPFKRSLSDGFCEASSAVEIRGKNEESEPEKAQDSRKGLSESSPEISTCESDSSYPRFIVFILWT